MDADVSYPLARLFDPLNMDHIPERQRMEQFEHRDLAHVKHYKAAVKIFGGPLSRKRVIVAPRMETPMKHRLGLYMDRKSPPPSKPFNTNLEPQIPPEKGLPEELVIAKQAQEREDKYKAWFKERQKFRNDLENMGLNIDWLTKKPDKSVLEKRVLRQLNDAKGQKIAEDLQESPKTSSERGSSASSGIPNVSVPTPLALKILEQHLREKKIRLIDLFTLVDRDKNWKISREEFVKVCDQQKIPISVGLLEDMMVTLDMNLDEELDYREIARGMEAWKRERRDERRKELSRETTSVSMKSGTSSQGKQQPLDDILQRSQQSTPSGQSPKSKPFSIPTIDTATSISRPNSKDKSREPTKSSLEVRTTSLRTKSGDTDNKIEFSSASIGKSGTGNTESKSERTGTKSGKTEQEKSAKSEKSAPRIEINGGGKGLSGNTSSNRSLSPQYLEPPDPDVRLEQLVLNEEAMVDLRKRDREALKGYTAKTKVTPGTIRTGSKAIDNHCMTSTMGGEIGEMVDAFRQRRLQEYYEVVDICEQNGVPLSRGLLEKVLLYPSDKPHSDIRKKIRPPDMVELLSSHFADPPKRPRTPIEVKHKDKVRRSKSGKLLIDTRHQYPTNASIAPYGYKMNLSTGRAVIKRKVDCWMTFEEYESLTKSLAIRYENMNVTPEETENAFWPGHLLDKMRLAMPPYDKPPTRDKENSIFTRVHRTKAVNYGYEPTDVWPQNEDGYTQIGIHDHYRNKYI